jgi:ceramide glucosyltransferase
MRLSFFLWYAGATCLVLAVCGGVYAIATALTAMRVLGGHARGLSAAAPGVTILKPLRGEGALLESALVSFLAQAYAGPIQVIFGLHSADDPAYAMALRLKQQFSTHDIVIVADPHLHGPNHKISNVINMMPYAKHGLIVLADADIKVLPGYLGAVAEALSRGGAGVVSCFYGGEGLTNGWSRLAAMGVSYRFLPNVLVGVASGLAQPCFGSTIALTRETLAAIGGFEAFVSFLADDFEIGRAVRAKGLAVVFPQLVVQHGCTESSLGELIRHEMRWARTIRTVEPLGYLGTLITYGVPLGLIGAVLQGFSVSSLLVLAAVLASQCFLKTRMDQLAGTSAGPLWMLPARDILSFGIFVASLFGNEVDWAGHRLRVGRNGKMSRI